MVGSVRNAAAYGAAVVLLLGVSGISCTPGDTARHVSSRSAGQEVLPALTREVLLDGLVDPWDIAFLPDGNLLFTESSGKVSLFLVHERQSQILLDAPPGFFYDGKQGGMLGIAVDPEFFRNRYIYTYMTSIRPGTGGRPLRVATTRGSPTLRAQHGIFLPEDNGYAISGDGTRLFDGRTTVERYVDGTMVETSRVALATDDADIELHAVENHVVRWILASDDQSLARDSAIITGIPYGWKRFSGHSGGRIRFGPDGYLWITTGDGDVDQSPQDGTSLGGKVLRVDRDGRPAPGNRSRPGFDPRIFTFGHRNPQGIAFDSKGTAFVSEHGDDEDDELNLLAAGANFGWAPSFADSPRHQIPPMTDRANFPDAREAIWRSGHPTIAPSGISFLYSGPRADWGGLDGTLLVASLKARCLMIVFLESGRVVRTTDALTEYQARLRAVVQGPDGAVYVTTDDAGDLINRPDGSPPRPIGEIWRIAPP